MVTTDWLERGIRAGLIAAAAVLGAILALAWRAGAPLEPMTSSGRAVLHGGAPALAFVAGLAMRLADGVLWGLALSVTVGGRRDWPTLIVVSAAVAGLAAVMHRMFVPHLVLGYGLGVFPIHGPPLYFLYLVFALALAAGMRIAR